MLTLWRLSQIIERVHDRRRHPFQPKSFSMKYCLSFPTFFLPLLFYILVGTSAMAADDRPSFEKIRTFFTGNVQAELGPCG
jgi:hypothetical protein